MNKKITVLVCKLIFSLVLEKMNLCMEDFDQGSIVVSNMFMGLPIAKVVSNSDGREYSIWRIEVVKNGICKKKR